MSQGVVAESVKPSWEKALEFARVVTSGVDHELAARRLEVCKRCERLDDPGTGKLYCGACGCGRWPLAELDRKLAFKGLECPLGKPEFANAGKPVPPLVPCRGCSMPGPDVSPIEVGEDVWISATMPGEPRDMAPWRVEARRGEPGAQVYDLRRGRRGWAWLRALGRPERATVSRSAIARGARAS